MFDVQYEYGFAVNLLANVSYGGAQKWVFSQDDGFNGGNYLPKSSPFYPKDFDASRGNSPPYVYIPGCIFPLNSTAPLAGTWLADSGTRGPLCCLQPLSASFLSFLVVALRALSLFVLHSLL